MTTKAAVLTNNAAPSVIHMPTSKNCAAAVDKSGAPLPIAELVIGMYATFLWHVAARFYYLPSQSTTFRTRSAEIFSADMT